VMYGLGLGNVAGSNDPERVSKIGAAAYLALHYQIDDLKRVLDQQPAARGIVRWFCQNLLSQSTEYVVNQLKRLVWDHPWVKEVIVGNELNLVDEQNPLLSPTYTALNLKAIFEALRREPALDGVILHLGAFSPSGNYLDYYKAIRDTSIPFDVLDVHCYGTSYRQLAEPLFAVSNMFTVPIEVTEWNWGAGNEVNIPVWATEARAFLDYATSIGVRGAHWFMWKWQYTQKGTSVDVMDTPMEQVLANLYSQKLVESQVSNISLSFPIEIVPTKAHGGRRTETRNIFIHSTRSGVPSHTLEQEYAGTVSYFLSPDGDSSHYVVGPSKTSRMVDDDNVAYHARENNAWAIGIEIAQPTDAFVYTDYQYKATAEIVYKLCKKYGIPIQHVTSQTQRGIIGHEDSEQGKRDGKSDPGHMWDWTKFLALVRAFDGAVIAPTPSTFQLGPGFAHIVEENRMTPLSNETYTDWGSYALARTSDNDLAFLIWRRYTNEAKWAKWSNFSG
jgi:hypothetical protein